MELCAPPGTVAALTELMGPWLRIGPPSVPAVTPSIEVVVEAGPGWASGPPVIPSALHAGRTGLAQRQPGRLVVHHPHLGAWYVLTPSRLRLGYPAGPDVHDVCQVLRSVLVELALLRGARLVHAAVLAVRGHGVALTGPKGAGKTSSVLALLQTGATFVSNDKALLWGDVAYGVPQAISASPWLRESMGGFPEHGSSRVAGGKELFFPHEMRPPPRTASAVDVEAWFDVRVGRGAAVGLWRLTGPAADAVDDSLLRFSNAVHGNWVGAALPAPTTGPGTPTALTRPRWRLRFDPWNPAQRPAVARALAEAAGASVRPPTTVKISERS
ncbi:hypothetical protein [Micromonospora marina]|uniref:hypothetical protein n=1 Tax=Micromonospora marina TaxID=307120 RepID=UPI003D75D758